MGANLALHAAASSAPPTLHATDLAAARLALESERRRLRELETALAESVACNEAARVRTEEMLRKLERYEREFRSLRETLAARDATVAQLQQSLGERESQVRDALIESVAGAQDERSRADEVTRRGLLASRDSAVALETRLQQSAAPPSAAHDDPASPPLQNPGRAGRGSLGMGGRGRVLGLAVGGVVLLVWVLFHLASAPPHAPNDLATAYPEQGSILRDCAMCPSVTVLPPGRFKQGSARGERAGASAEKPLHWVLIARPLGMTTNAVTVDEFGQFVSATGRVMQGCDIYDADWHNGRDNSWMNPGFEQAGRHPVTCVSWNDAQSYAQWLSASSGHRYRLPTASEWEYAARAGGEASQPWAGDGAEACTNANVADESAGRRYPGWSTFACDDGFVNTSPVGSFKANGFGLNDMLGNVSQWTQDCWNADYNGAPIDGSARQDGDCAERELRGGSWFSEPAYVRANYRSHFGVDYRTSSTGIRLVRELE